MLPDDAITHENSSYGNKSIDYRNARPTQLDKWNFPCKVRRELSSPYLDKTIWKLSSLAAYVTFAAQNDSVIVFLFQKVAIIRST